MARTRRPRRTTRRQRGAMGYRVDVPRSLAALIVGDPRLSESALRLLAHSVIHVMRNSPGNTRLAHLLTEDPNEFVAGLRQLHDRGWISVFDGQAYLSEPVHGPLGNVVDRVRMSAIDRRAFVQLFGDSVLDDLGEATG